MKSTQVTCHCQVKSSQVECDQVDGSRLGVDFSLKSGHVSVPQRLAGLVAVASIYSIPGAQGENNIDSTCANVKKFLITGLSIMKLFSFSLTITAGFRLPSPNAVSILLLFFCHIRPFKDLLHTVDFQQILTKVVY